MSQTLTISDELYSRLRNVACEKGFDSIEQFLERESGIVQRTSEEELRRRQETGRPDAGDSRAAA